MASISRRTVAGSPRYDVNYREPDGRRRRKTFQKKAQADDFATAVETDKRRGAYIDPEAGRVTFKTYAVGWLAAQTFEESTREAVELRLRVHVFPVLGSKLLAQVKPSTVQAWISGMAVSPSYQRVIFTNVSTIFSAAVDDERISKNPCSAGSVRTPRSDHRRVVPWTGERLSAVREALPAQYRVALDLGAGLMLRQGEVFALSPDDIDFLRGVVEIQRQVKIVGSRQVFAPPKGGKTRTVPIGKEVLELLAAHLAARPAKSVTLPWRAAGGASTSVPLVLSTRESTALNRNYFNTFVWRPALVRAGTPIGRENGMHALRHFGASVLLDAGESIKAVSEYLGHADPGFTLRTYTHLMPTSSERTRRAIDATFARYITATSNPESEALEA